jgi:predicted TIM-barrel fold metal-dependent hydrolase
MGTDWPFIKFPPLPTHKEWFDFIRNLKVPEPGLVFGMRDFSQEEKDKILGENARAVLKC